MTDLSVRPFPLEHPGGVKLRYGENAWQGADLFSHFSSGDPLALGKFVLEKGELPSTTNITDLDRAVHTLSHTLAAMEANGHKHGLAAIAVKHGNCCGAGYGNYPTDTILKMRNGDRQAILGGVLAFSFPLDTDESNLLVYHDTEQRRIFDAIIAPQISAAALEILQRQNNRCKIFSNQALSRAGLSLNSIMRTRSVRGGTIVQDADNRVLRLDDTALQVFGMRSPQFELDIAFGSGLCRTSNSNTITIVKQGMLLGQGVGQTRRDRAARLAVMIAQENGHDLEGAVAISDSFFPFADGVEPLIAAGVKAIFSTSGAMRDSEVQRACIDAGVTLYQLPDKEARMFFGH